MASLFTLATMLVLKIGFLTCGRHVLNGIIVSPSGHTATSALVYGGLACLALSRSPQRWARVLIIMAALAWIALIGLTRVLLDAHNVIETIFGAAVGLSGVAIFATGLRRAPARPLPLRRMAAALLLGLIALHGLTAPAEAMIMQAAELLVGSTRVCAPG